MKTAVELVLFIAVIFGPVIFIVIQVEREKRRRAALREDPGTYLTPAGSEAAGLQAGSAWPPADVSHHHPSGAFPGMIDGGGPGGGGHGSHGGH